MCSYGAYGGGVSVRCCIMRRSSRIISTIEERRRGEGATVTQSAIHDVICNALYIMFKIVKRSHNLLNL